MNRLSGMLCRTIGLAAMLLGLQMTGAQAAGENTSTATVLAQPAIVYKPPLRGAPQARVPSAPKSS